MKGFGVVFKLSTTSFKLKSFGLHFIYSALIAAMAELNAYSHLQFYKVQANVMLKLYPTVVKKHCGNPVPQKYFSF